MKLALRYAITINSLLTAFAIVLVATLLFTFNKAFNNLVETNRQNTQQQVQQQTSSHLIHISQQFTSNIANALYFYDLGEIKTLAQIAQAHPHINTIRILDKDQTILFDGTGADDTFGKALFFEAIDLSTIDANTPFLYESENEMTVFMPVVISEDILGYAVLSASLDGLQNNLIHQNKLIKERTNDILFSSIVNAIFVLVVMLFVGLAVSTFIARNLSNPINKLVHLASLIGIGKLDARVELNRSDELAVLGKSLNDMAESMEAHNELMSFQANHDALTLLPNRRSIREFIERLTESTNTPEFAVIFIDIDDFKLINDIHGHSTGDAALRVMSSRLTKIIEPLNSNERDEGRVSRFSGDEFVMVLTCENLKQTTKSICNKIVQQLTQPIFAEGVNVEITVSVGVAYFPIHGSTASTLITKADAAMYRVKNNTKNDFSEYNTSFDREEQQRIALIKDFSRAFDNNELELWYQPQYSVETAELVGTEALLRWAHPTQGYIPPSKILPLIEHRELTHRLATWVLDNALMNLKEIGDVCEQNFTLSINFSPEQLHRYDIVRTLQQHLATQPNLTKYLHIEITESEWIQHHEIGLKNIQELRELGFKIWLDDFGTGYSSFLRLKALPVDGVKIDKSFVANIDKSASNRAIAESIVGTAKAFNIAVIAEGVETAEELRILEEMGCPVIQGYFAHHPMSFNQFKSQLKNDIISQSHSLLRVIEKQHA